MTRLVNTVLVGAVFLALAWPMSQAQDQGAQTDAENDARPYVPPAPSKSVEIGNYYLRRKKYSAALSRYKEAVSDDPYYAAGYLGLAKAYDKMGFKQKALHAYRKYLDLLPSDKDAQEAKEVHKAIERLEKG